MKIKASLLSAIAAPRNTMSWFCYWATLFLLALADWYLLRWQLAHPLHDIKTVQLEDSPPAWMLNWGLAAGTAWSLGWAVWSALHRQCNRDAIIVTGLLVAVTAGACLLEAYIEHTGQVHHRLPVSPATQPRPALLKLSERGESPILKPSEPSLQAVFAFETPTGGGYMPTKNAAFRNGPRKAQGSQFLCF